MHHNNFADFSLVGNISGQFLGPNAGIGLTKFEWQILLGCELLVRLLKEPRTTSYRGRIGDKVSATLLISDMWMKNVDILPKLSSYDINGNRLTGNVFDLLYIFSSAIHERQVEGLIRFAEILRWPWIAEVREYMENLRNEMEMMRVIPLDISDWIFGLLLPGTKFRHKIMSCLVTATPSVRTIKSPPFYDSGLVLEQFSYWPSSTALGRVLGGLKEVRSVCGWLGPCPKIEGQNIQGWIRTIARKVVFPTPCSDLLDGMGLGTDDEGWSHGQGLMSQGYGDRHNESLLMDFCDINNWEEGDPMLQSAYHRITLTKIKLQSIDSAALSLASLYPGSYSASETRDHRPILEFLVNGTTQTYTLYTKPSFISAHPCVGRHLMYSKQAEYYKNTVVDAVDLRNYVWDGRGLLVINAMSSNAEALARAWCSEHGRHAVIRRGPDCCFACATSITGSAGLGVKVLIWS